MTSISAETLPKGRHSSYSKIYSREGALDTSRHHKENDQVVEKVSLSGILGWLTKEQGPCADD